MLLAAAVLAAGACAGGSDAGRSSAPPPPIAVDWSDPSFRTELTGGWIVRNCGKPEPRLCVERDGTTLGSIGLKDLPSLGEEKTTSEDQIQAVLAGRINSMYQFKIGRWAHECGRPYHVMTERPKGIPVAGDTGMKYKLSGRKGAREVEVVVGYWIYRDGIETVIEASAATPERCSVEPLGQVAADAPNGAPPLFSPDSLASLEPALDRIAAGSRLPPPTRFEEQPGR